MIPGRVSVATLWPERADERRRTSEVRTALNLSGELRRLMRRELLWLDGEDAEKDCWLPLFQGDERALLPLPEGQLLPAHGDAPLRMWAKVVCDKFFCNSTGRSPDDPRALCPLCRSYRPSTDASRRDGWRHRTGACKHPAMEGMRTKLHDDIVRLLADAVLKGRLGGWNIYADVEGYRVGETARPSAPPPRPIPDPDGTASSDDDEADPGEAPPPLADAAFRPGAGGRSSRTMPREMCATTLLCPDLVMGSHLPGPAALGPHGHALVADFFIASERKQGLRSAAEAKREKYGPLLEELRWAGWSTSEFVHTIGIGACGGVPPALHQSLQDLGLEPGGIRSFLKEASRITVDGLYRTLAESRRLETGPQYVQHSRLAGLSQKRGPRRAKQGEG